MIVVDRCGYDAVLERFEEVQAQEDQLPLHSRCRSTLLTHGATTAHAVVYFHGFTSCPAQGLLLATRLHKLGMNVYLPRMFGHGGREPARFSMADLSIRKLIELANESVDIGAGLGNKLTVLGLSAGGTIASWVAQYRSDVSHVIGISPFFAPFMLPSSAVTRASELILRMPNFVLGWNPLTNAPVKEVDYPFAKPATHALAQIMLLGQQVHSAARAAPPAAEEISVLLNAADRSVSNEVTRAVVDLWGAKGKTTSVKVLPLEHRLPHDLINPLERGNDFEKVYATLADMIVKSEKEERLC